MLSGSAQTRRIPGFSTLGRSVWARRLLIGRNAAARRPRATERLTGQERDIDQEFPMKRKRHPSEQHRAPSLTSVMYPRKRPEGKPRPFRSPAYFMVGFLRAKTVSTPPWVLKLPASPNA